MLYACRTLHADADWLRRGGVSVTMHTLTLNHTACGNDKMARSNIGIVSKSICTPDRYLLHPDLLTFISDLELDDPRSHAPTSWPGVHILLAG